MCLLSGRGPGGVARIARDIESSGMAFNGPKRALLRRVLRSSHPVPVTEAARALQQAKRILLVKPHHKIGDLMVATPLIRNLRLALPDAELVFLAGRGNVAAISDSPDLDRILVMEARGTGAWTTGHRVARELRRSPIDVALVLSTISQSATAILTTRRSNPRLIAGLDDTGWGDLSATYDCVVPPPDAELLDPNGTRPRVNMVDYTSSLVERLGIRVRTREHQLTVTETQARDALHVLGAAGLDPQAPLLGLQPGGAGDRTYRQWPPEAYVALGRRARETTGAQVAILGGPGDAETAREVARGIGTGAAALTDLPFGTYKGVLRSLGFFVTHDGGPAHFGAGVGVSCFLMYLGSPSWLWAPQGAHVHTLDSPGAAPEAETVWRAAEAPLRGALGGLDSSAPRGI